MPGAPAPTARWAWMGLGFDAPADWSATRHDLRRDAGRLVLVDRRRQRLQLTWSALPDDADPQPEALAADWRKRVAAAVDDDAAVLRPLNLETRRPPAKDGAPSAPRRLKKEPLLGPTPGTLQSPTPSSAGRVTTGLEPPPTPKPHPLGPTPGTLQSPTPGTLWSGWVSVAATPAGPATRVDAVARVGGLLMDAVLIDPPGPRAGRAPSTAASALLRSAAAATLPGDATRWSAFGLHAAVPTGWSVTSARHEPAASVLAAAGPGRLAVRLWRRGMASSWFDGNPVALLEETTPKRVHADVSPGDPPAAEAAGPEPCRAWPRLAGKARHRRDLLWHDRVRNAVLGVTVRGPRRTSLPDPRTFLPA